MVMHFDDSLEYTYEQTRYNIKRVVVIKKNFLKGTFFFSHFFESHSIFEQRQLYQLIHVFLDASLS